MKNYWKNKRLPALRTVSFLPTVGLITASPAPNNNKIFIFFLFLLLVSPDVIKLRAAPRYLHPDIQTAQDQNLKHIDSVTELKFWIPDFDNISIFFSKVIKLSK